MGGSEKDPRHGKIGVGRADTQMKERGFARAHQDGEALAVDATSEVAADRVGAKSKAESVGDDAVDRQAQS